MDSGTLVTLRYTLNEPCVLEWKFKVDKGDIRFGIQKKKALQNILFREEVSNYRLALCESSEASLEGPLDGENIVSVTSDTCMTIGLGLPEIQIHSEEEKESKKTSRKNSLQVSIWIQTKDGYHSEYEGSSS